MLCPEEEAIIRRLIAEEQANDPVQNPNGLPVSVFIEQNSSKPLTPEVIASYQGKISWDASNLNPQAIL